KRMERFGNGGKHKSPDDGQHPAAQPGLSTSPDAANRPSTSANNDNQKKSGKTQKRVAENPENSVGTRKTPRFSKAEAKDDKDEASRVPMRWLPFDVYYLLLNLNFKLTTLFRYREVCRDWNQAIEQICTVKRSLRINLYSG